MRPRTLTAKLVALFASHVLSVLPTGCSTSGASSPTPDASCPSDLPASCPPGAAHYTPTVAAIFASRCGGCHADGGIEVQAHDLSSYAPIHAQRQSVLSQVYGCLMPPDDAGALTAQERAALLGWLVCGAPND